MLQAKKTIKLAFLLITFLLALIFASSSSSAAFGDLYNCNNIIVIDYDENLTNQPLLPIDMVLDIPLKIKYYVQGQYADYITKTYLSMGYDSYIYLEIGKTPEWCEATISPPVLLMPATTTGEIENANLSIKISQEAQAFDAGEISIKFNVTKMGAIQKESITKNISFKTGYLAILKINATDGIVKSITPNEIADFNIEIENLGNGKTNVSVMLTDLPEGWTVTIPSNFIIDSKGLNENNKKTVQLNIKPPYNFGYHNEKETITVVIKPSYFKDITVSGGEYYLTFIVKSKGFSTPGFEFVFLLLSLITVSLIVKRKKFYFKNGGL